MVNFCNSLLRRTLIFKKSVIYLIKVNYTSHNYTLCNSTWTCLKKPFVSERLYKYGKCRSWLWWYASICIHTEFYRQLGKWIGEFCLIFQQNGSMYSVFQNSIAPPDFSGNHGNHRNWVPRWHMPYPCSHFYIDINFGDRLYSKEKRLGYPLLFWI